MFFYNYLLIPLLLLFLLSGCEKVTPLNGSHSATINNSVPSTITIINSHSKEAQNLYRSRCTGCHGERGEKSALGVSLPIAKLDKETLLYELKEYKVGNMDFYGFGALMKGQLASLTQEELESLAGYIPQLDDDTL